ncbi:mitochondrial cardiolipin hydrolase-like [Anthonomus grandis grandis]|uniref:mitochondrial cardiolipin hydrolase-like n=1 Tax=Anthonomus grandis grandis TaxID=2921223 RepID=UPI0021664CF5|nr:mitochondrial cardiolipin hydrolase-like [Anthonomus grandis grandis]
MTKKLAISLLITITTIPLILRYFLKRKYEKLARQLYQKDDTSYYECIFFDYKNFRCKPHLINKEECGDNCSYTRLRRLLHYIGSAKKSISMCMYMLTLQQVCSELVKASERGVTVRLITDKIMVKTSAAGSNIQYLQKHGVICKTQQKADKMMHHKFCLIDECDTGSSKVFFGSLNLTAQAFCKNFEALILTNNKDIIQRLSQEFEELWQLM